MRTIITIMLTLLASCSSPDGGRTIANSGDVDYVCDKGECGEYPEQFKCQDGTPAIDARCVFIDKIGTCTWVGSNCKLDPDMEGCNL